MKFEYVIELKEGYKPVMELEYKDEVRMVIEAPNRVTADRMAKAVLQNAPNVKIYDGFCIDQTRD